MPVYCETNSTPCKAERGQMLSWRRLGSFWLDKYLEATEKSINVHHWYAVGNSEEEALNQ